ncbi:MAG TPA: DEAD/DEAH box helicase, partial [Candidatus Nanopelagicales bacterium]|nr:DEAD/DEAH box helicase [Candidatus Nanopelagicales bacterium]
MPGESRSRGPFADPGRTTSRGALPRPRSDILTTTEHDASTTENDEIVQATPDVAALPAAEPKTFAELGVDPAIVEALAADGIITAFPIQELTLPMALAGTDLIGQAKTGTGKTLGFGIPLLQKVVAPEDAAYAEQKDAVRGKPQALVVVPTRELGIQVASDLQKTGRVRGVRVLCVYGGRAYEPQVDALQKGIEVVVGTPGRLIDLARQGHLDLKHVQTLVLDEADEMLDMGFLPDVERIVALTPATRQTMLFSATMPGQIVALARRYMTQPTHIRALDPHDENATVDAIEQHVWRAHSLDKQELIARVLQAEGRGLTIIFCRTKRNAQRVADDLAERGFAAAAVHGDLGQGAREQALRAFRNGKVDVLVATDVAARGIDVADVTHVINWECPDDDKTYLHRIGRTGRAGNSGVAVTLVDWDDLHKWKMISQALGLPFDEPIETYSSSPHVYTGLGIPAGTKGRLPKGSQTRAGLDAEVIEDLGETGAAAGKRNRAGKSHGDKAHGDKAHGEKARSEKARGSGGHDRPRREERDKDGADRPRRERRRTRSGENLDGSAPAEAAPAPDADGGAGPGEDQPRRRRRRGGRGRGGSSGAAAEAAAPV